MESHARLVRRATFSFIVACIGVGIFGLPYVFQTAGTVLSLSYLIILAVLNTVVLVALGDLLVGTPGHRRLTGIIERYLGRPWKYVASLLLLGVAWGAMLAYTLLGGEFLHALLAPTLSASVFTYQVLFYLVASFFVIGGVGFIGRVESFLTYFLVGCLLVIVAGSSTHIDVSYVSTIHKDAWFLPFGVILFALGGLQTVPEMSEMLGRYKRSLPKAILLGTAAVVVIYACFAVSLSLVTGPATSEDGIIGVAGVLGDWALYVGGAAGFLATFTSYLMMGTSIIESLTTDFKWRFFKAWAVAVLVPMVALLAGAKHFIHVVGFTGAVLGSLLSIMIVLSYLSAQRDPDLPKRHFAFPRSILYICIIVLLFGAITAIIV